MWKDFWDGQVVSQVDDSYAHTLSPAPSVLSHIDVVSSHRVMFLAPRELPVLLLGWVGPGAGLPGNPGPGQTRSELPILRNKSRRGLINS